MTYVVVRVWHGTPWQATETVDVESRHTFKCRADRERRRRARALRARFDHGSHFEVRHV